MLDPSLFLIWLSIVLLSTVVPLGIYFGRNNVRAIRRDIVKGLEKMFDFAHDANGNPIVIPSFELVKYKYDQDEQDAVAEGNGIRVAKAIDRKTNRAPASPQSMAAYAIPVIIYVLLCAACFYCSFVKFEYPENAFTRGLIGSPESRAGLQTMQTYTFLGGYVWSIQYLIRRIGSFDLAPISFFQATAHLLFGLFVTAVFWQCGLAQKLGSFSIALAFLIGFTPLLAIDFLVSKFPWLRFKKVDPDGKKLLEELPLDMILGIDQFIKLRLAEFEILDIQNLATINPLQIFVETPYGLYEVIDWVAQAQLILAVGAKKTLALRAYGIRTVFDLEKALQSVDLRTKLGAILVTPEKADGDPALEKRNAPTSSDDGSELAVDPRFQLDAVVGIIRDDLHVRRLRQIWDVINAQLSLRPPLTSTNPRQNDLSSGNVHVLPAAE